MIPVAIVTPVQVTKKYADLSRVNQNVSCSNSSLELAGRQQIRFLYFGDPADEKSGIRSFQRCLIAMIVSIMNPITTTLDEISNIQLAIDFLVKDNFFEKALIWDFNADYNRKYNPSLNNRSMIVQKVQLQLYKGKLNC